MWEKRGVRLGRDLGEGTFGLTCVAKMKKLGSYFIDLEDVVQKPPLPLKSNFASTLTL